MPLALLALAVSAFGIGTTEFVMMGLLPNVADDLGTSDPHRRTPRLRVRDRRRHRRPAAHRARLPDPAQADAGAAHGAVHRSATSPPRSRPATAGCSPAACSRGLPHGAFFGVGAVVAARLVAEDRRARAVATMFLGLTVANIVGVPAGTALGQHLGWRATFLVVSAIGLVAMAALARLVPHLPVEHTGGLGRELRALGHRQVRARPAHRGLRLRRRLRRLQLPRLDDDRGRPGFAESSVTLVLALFGIGMTLGALIAGPLTDRALRPTLYGGLAALAVALARLPAHRRTISGRRW